MKKISASDIILLVLSLILLFGTAFVFHACPQKEDGSWMMCHWAGNVVTGLASVFSFVSLVRLFIPCEKIKTGISLAFVPFAVVTALVPGILVPLCMMKDMRCHTIMRPSVVVISILILAVSLIDFIVKLKKTKRA